MIEANKIVERIGLIDLGSNTARLVIFDVLEGGYFMVADEMVEAVRLGETEIDGSLKQTRVMQAINTVKVFKKLCAVFRVDKILAVATAAVRRAKNQRTFLNEMFGTLVLVFGALCCLSLAWGKQDYAAASIVVGFIVWGLVTSMGGPTGPGLNPARDLMPRLLHAILPIPHKGSSRWGEAWIPVVAPIVGAIIGAWLFVFFFAN